jgi:hypothetical protein
MPPTSEACRATAAVPRETSSAISHGMTARTPSPSPPQRRTETHASAYPAQSQLELCCTLGLAFLQDMIKHPSPDRPSKDLASVGELDRPHARYGTRGPGRTRASQLREVRGALEVSSDVSCATRVLPAATYLHPAQKSGEGLSSAPSTTCSRRSHGHFEAPSPAWRWC